MKNNDQIHLEGESYLNDSKRLLANGDNLFFKFGFSSNQSKVYHYLSKIGTKTASQLSKTLDIPRTETYHLLKTLQEKGCIFRIYEKPLKFGAVSIEEFFEKWIISEKNKIKKLEETLSIIKKLKSPKNFLTNTQEFC